MTNKLLKKCSMLFALTMFLSLSHTVNAQYCVPEGTSSTRYIDNFSTTGGVQDISNLNSGFSTGGYGDYTDTHTVVRANEESFDFSADVKGGSAGFRVWVDWNQDGVFDTTDELAYFSTDYELNHTGTIIVPADALEGDTRMRIVSNWLTANGGIDPCETGFSYGEFEDYKVTIGTVDACTGTPDAGFAVVNPISGNAGTSYTVLAQGYTAATDMSFQWQSNTNGAGWEDEGAATDLHAAYDATAPLEIGDEVEWRLALTCTASGETAFSDVATFTVTLIYCDSTAGSVEPITKVIFAGIDNFSSPTNNDGYEDFTSIVAEVEAGETYSFAGEGHTGGNYTNNFTTWIDWNRNGEFEVDEMYLIGSINASNGEDGKQAISDIEVPADALLGETRMRVIKTYGTNPSTNPCGSVSFGQVEDYTVNVSAATGGTFPSPYCEIADADDVSVEEITQVDFAGTSITNEDTDSVLVDKTDIIVNIVAGETYTLSVEGNTHGDFDNSFVAFIDWNQNDILDDAGEIYELGTLTNSTGDDGLSVSLEITVPVDAVLGTTRIRITKTYWDEDSDPIINPCGIEFDPWGMGAFPSFGQALDFTLEIESSDCAGTPDAGVATVDPEEGDVNSAYTVSAAGYTEGTGLTYQWQSNTDGAGWEDEGDLEVSYASFDATAPADSGIAVEWRLEVTCTLSQETSYSEIAVFTTTTITSGYCTPVLDCTDADMITNVTFQEIDNTTTCSTDGYGDYTAMSATVEAGGTYPISVSVGDGWASESVSVWIDFDNNGTFEENEFFFIGTGSDEALTADITIPADVADGDYRMRVRVAAVGEASATWDMSCDEDQGYGETEDYTVTVDGVMGMDDYVVSNFTYYPNPMEDVLYIAADKDVQSVSIYNVLGQEVLSNNRFTDGKVDVSSLPTGTFVFRVTFENGHTENFKAIKK